MIRLLIVIMFSTVIAACQAHEGIDNSGQIGGTQDGISRKSP
jgi:hypothetical protein